jgi:hypothetical protein
MSMGVGICFSHLAEQRKCKNTRCLVRGGVMGTFGLHLANCAPHPFDTQQWSINYPALLRLVSQLNGLWEKKVAS